MSPEKAEKTTIDAGRRRDTENLSELLRYAEVSLLSAARDYVIDKRPGAAALCRKWAKVAKRIRERMVTDETV